MPDIETDRDEFFKAKAVKMLSGKDVTIAANGITASAALEAAALLKKEGIEAEVFSVPFVKPLDSTSIFESAEKTGCLVTVEEHLLSGCFYSALAEEGFKSGLKAKVSPIAINDKFGETGPYLDLLAKYGLDAKSICENVKKLLSK